MMVNKLVFTRKELLQYLMIWLLFIFHDSIIQRNNELILSNIVFAVCIYAIVKYKHLQNKQIFLVLFLFLLDIIFVRYINNNGIGLVQYIKCADGILLAFLTVNLDKSKFYSRFVKLVSLYAVISIICTMFIYLGMKNIWFSIMPLTRLVNNGLEYYGIPFIHTVGTFYDKTYRNLGIFTEPGLYQILLNTAIFIILFCNKQLGMTDSMKQKCLYCIIMALILAQSTTGYLACGIIIAGSIFLTSHSQRKKILFLILTVIAVVFGDFIVNGSNSFIFVTIIRKFIGEDGNFSMTAGSGSQRLYYANTLLTIIKKHPLGLGIDNLYSLTENMGSNNENSAGVALLQAFAFYGLYATSAMYLWFILKIRKNHKKILVVFVVILLYINTTFAQSNVFYPGLLLLIFIESDNKEVINLPSHECI